MSEENRTDLPHDQVAQDNDGEQGFAPNEQGAMEDRPLDAGEVTAGGVTPLAGAAFEDEILEPVQDDRNDAPTGEKREEGLNNFEEETAAEVAPNIRPENRDNEQLQNVEEMEAQEEGNATLGWTALVLSIVSLFFLPVLTASVGIITGFFAYRNGGRTLGIWAIAIGIFSIVLSLFLAPFVR